MRKKTGKIVNCDYCNKKFYKSGWDLKRRKHYFCNPVCGYKFQIGKKLSEKTKQKIGASWSNLPEEKQIERRQKISKRMKGENNPFYGKKHPQETINRIIKANKGRIPWNKEVPSSDENREKLRKAKIGMIYVGENNPSWKGDKVGYFGLHKWVYKKLGRPKKCEHCGEIKENNRALHWANKSGEYKRDIGDWLRLCVPCHSRYDKGFVR